MSVKQNQQPYHIRINKSIRHNRDLEQLIVSIISGYLNYLTYGFSKSLQSLGLNNVQIGQYHPIKQSRQQICKTLKKYSQQLAASEDGLAKLSCKKGGKASLSSLAASSDDDSNSSQNYSVKKESSSHE